jgi:hypothetical protein
MCPFVVVDEMSRVIIVACHLGRLRDYTDMPATSRVIIVACAPLDSSGNVPA